MTLKTQSERIASLEANVSWIKEALESQRSLLESIPNQNELAIRSALHEREERDFNQYLHIDKTIESLKEDFESMQSRISQIELFQTTLKNYWHIFTVLFGLGVSGISFLINFLTSH